MMTEEQRQAFEAQCKKIAVEYYGYSDNPATISAMLERNGKGQYYVMWVQGAALGWMASREAVVIGRPEKCEFADPDGDYAKGYRLGIRSMVDVIEAQGLKVAR